MRLFAGILVMSMIATVLAMAALVQLAIALLPYLAVALIVALVWQRRRRDNATPSAAASPLRTYPVRAVVPPRCRVGAPAPAPEGWVMVPVWVPPAGPDPRVIDVEVISDDG